MAYPHCWAFTGLVLEGVIRRVRKGSKELLESRRVYLQKGSFLAGAAFGSFPVLLCRTNPKP